MKFIWDDNKAKINVRKHGIGFDQAMLIFADPWVMTIPDEEHSIDEVREISMGLEPIGNVIIVVHTTVISGEQEWTRLISARKANKTETAMYFEKRGNV